MYHDHNLENTTHDYKTKYKCALHKLEMQVWELERALEASETRVRAHNLRSETDDASDALVSKKACENWKARMLADCEACTVTDPLIRFNKEDIYYFHNGLHV